MLSDLASMPSSEGRIYADVTVDHDEPRVVTGRRPRNKIGPSVETKLNESRFDPRDGDGLPFLHAQARELDRAIASEVGSSLRATGPVPDGGLAFLVSEARQNREALHQLFGEMLLKFEERQHATLRQHMRCVSELLRRVHTVETRLNSGRPPLGDQAQRHDAGGPPSHGLSGTSTMSATPPISPRTPRFPGTPPPEVAAESERRSGPRELLCGVREVVRGELQTALAQQKEALVSTIQACDTVALRSCSPEVQTATSIVQSKGREVVAGSSERDSADAAADLLVSDIEHMATYMHLINRVESNVPMLAQTQWEVFAEMFPKLSHRARALSTWAGHVASATPPERNDCLSRFHDSGAFRAATEMLIVLNAIFMGFVADEEIKSYSASLSDFSRYGEHFFVGAFSLEFVVRFARSRWNYFYGVGSVLNWFDFIILLSSALWLVFLETVPNVTWLRLGRTVRLLKALRVIRIMVMFKTLRALIISVSSTMVDFFWSMVMITLFLYLFALIFVMRVASHLRNNSDTMDPEEELDLLGAFGSVQQAMLSLFMSTNGGDDWAIFFYALEPTGKFNQGVFLVFVAFTNLVLLNIILGIFVDHVEKNLVLSASKEERASEHAESERLVEEDLRALCQLADKDGSGRISLEAWREAVENAKSSAYMDMMGFRMYDMMEYFHLCLKNSIDDQVSIDIFVQGCMRLKGSASWFDQQATAFEIRQLANYVYKKLK